MRKTVLITGIKRIGGYICEYLLSKGYNVSAVYRRSNDYLRDINSKDLLLIKADLNDSDIYKEVVDKTWERFGRIDAFIHLASPYYKTPWDKITKESLYDHFKPITEAFLFISKYCADYMLKNEGDVKGRIIAFGDWAVTNTPYKGYVSYFVSKGALHTAVKVLAKELAPHILVNCIALGPVLRAEGMSEEEWEGLLKRTPLRRKVPLEDIGLLVDYLLKVEGMTGEIINLDSGRHIAGSGV